MPAKRAQKRARGTVGTAYQEHVVVSPDDWISDYIALLGDGTEEGKYLSSIPWILDANPQTPDVLIPALRMEAARFQELAFRPTFSLLTVLRDTGPRHLRELILSCRCLSYQDWNLVLVDDGSRVREHLDLARDWCARDSRIHLIMLETPRGPCHAKNLAIEQATGDYLILVDGDGMLHPMALGLLARHINEDPNISLVFSNEAEIDRNSTRLANFLRKPPFDSFTLLRVPYLGRLLAVRRRLLEDCTGGGPAFRHEYEGIEEHDLWLRLALTGRVVSRHIPPFAYYRRAGFAAQASLYPSSIQEKRHRLLAEHVPRAYPGAVWTAKVPRDRDPLASSSVWISNLPGQPPPRLLAVIPFEDFELMRLYERHGQMIGTWRPRHLNRAPRHPWPILVLPWNDSPNSVPGNGEATALPVHDASQTLAGQSHWRPPLRHRLADKVVEVLKLGLGPAYGGVRSAAIKYGKLCRRLRSPAARYSMLRTLIKPVPLLGPLSAGLVRGARKMTAAGIAARRIAGHLRRNPASGWRLARSFHAGGALALLQDLAVQIPTLQLESRLASLWFKRTQPSPAFLAALRAREWPAAAPKASVIMPVYNIREDWLRQAVESVLAQTYPNWELICVNDASRAPHVKRALDELASRDSRMVVIHSERNRGVAGALNLGLSAATGDYVFFMDHDDFLQPHALQRFAEAILQDRPDMLYSDEAVTGEDIEKILRIDSRPAFSYDHYLGHPYFVHLIAVRTDLVRKVGGLDETMSISQDVDLNLRLIEVCQTICHVPEVLYRWRTHRASLGHQKMHLCRASTRQALERHFARTRQAVVFEDESHFNYRNVRFQHNWQARVVILIVSVAPNIEIRHCLGSLERTVDPSLADIVVIDHQSNVAARARDLADVRKQYHVVTHRGRMNLSEIINTGVAAVQGPYTHYLILSPEIEAIDRGWLEHMLGYWQRTDVGVVGALFLGQREVVHGAGLIIGRDGITAHAFQGSPYRHWIAGRNPGQSGSLLASRGVSAVSAACMLTRADVFHRLDGFDERLVVVLGDADYCLRASASGYKVIHDAYSVLLHRGDDSRFSSLHGQHPEDVRLFRDRHRALIETGDPFHHWILGIPRISIDGRASGNLVPTLKPRTTRVVLPPAATSSMATRIQVHGAEEMSRGRHPQVRTEASRAVDTAMNKQAE